MRQSRQYSFLDANLWRGFLISLKEIQRQCTASSETRVQSTNYEGSVSFRGR